MLTKTYISALLASIAIQASALPTDSASVPAASNGEQMVELHREPAQSKDGFIVYFGLPSEQHEHEHKPDHTKGPQNTNTTTTHAAHQARGRCTKSPELQCGSKNLLGHTYSAHSARNDICASLASELTSDASVGVPNSPRQICFEGQSAEKNQYCCVSWSTPITGLTKGDLLPAVNQISTTCTSNGISGLVRNNYLHNTCATICLSNRGTHCS